MPKHVQPGQSLQTAIVARDYNAALDAGQAHREAEHATQRDRARPAPPRACVVRCRNTQGIDIPLGGVCAFYNSAVLFDKDDNEAEYLFNTSWGFGATNGQHLWDIGIAAEPIPRNDVGRVVVCGIALAQVNVLRITDRWAKPILGVGFQGLQWLESSATTGLPLYTRATSTGVHLLPVIVGAPRDPDHQFWHWSEGSQSIDQGEEIDYQLGVPNCDVGDLADTPGGLSGGVVLKKPGATYRIEFGGRLHQAASANSHTTATLWVAVDGGKLAECHLYANGPWPGTSGSRAVCYTPQGDNELLTMHATASGTGSGPGGGAGGGIVKDVYLDLTLP